MLHLLLRSGDVVRSPTVEGAARYIALDYLAGQVDPVAEIVCPDGEGGTYCDPQTMQDVLDQAAGLVVEQDNDKEAQRASTY